ncbi:uncharacterized protein LOC109831572 isoform X3 [Asparagus officinalis]|uniref:uncharacterized protein LOC109831572 isoform X3 n=1 Tax=Asparagus officinalis TaxID=4686 RepID=UPI00098E11A8|nr:uncharacterized protein LOC109831572 isoform X3 [Asparagus officinalis]
MYRNKAPTVQISTFGNAPSNQSHVELLKKKRSHAATSDLPYVNSAGNGSGSNLSTKRTRLQTSNQECQTFVANGLNSSSTVVTTERTTTSPYAEMFANKIGYTIRNYAPLNVEKWKKIEKADVKNLIKRMQNKFEFDMSLPWVQRYVITTCQAIYLIFAIS